MDTQKSHEPRVIGGHSLHEVYDPEKCPRTSSNPEVQREQCGFARCVDCCGQEKDRDIAECSKCGLQKSVPCYLDDECS